MTHTPDPSLFERPINIVVCWLWRKPQRHRRRPPLFTSGTPGVRPSRRPECHVDRSRHGERNQLCAPAVLPNRDRTLQGSRTGASSQYVLGAQLAGRAGKNRAAKQGRSSRHPHWLCRYPKGQACDQSLGFAFSRTVLARSWEQRCHRTVRVGTAQQLGEQEKEESPVDRR